MMEKKHVQSFTSPFTSWWYCETEEGIFAIYPPKFMFDNGSTTFSRKNVALAFDKILARKISALPETYDILQKMTALLKDILPLIKPLKLIADCEKFDLSALEKLINKAQLYFDYFDGYYDEEDEKKWRK